MSEGVGRVGDVETEAEGMCGAIEDALPLMFYAAHVHVQAQKHKS